MSVAARKVINRRVRYETEHAAEVHEGHPFFPYAMFHDVVVNLIIVLMIPGAIGGLIFVHMWLVVKLGVTPWPSRPLPEPAPQPSPAPRAMPEAVAGE